MMKDLLLDIERDIDIASDDLVIGLSDEQHREHLLLFEKGALKENLGTGVGLATFIEAEDEAGLLREVAVQFSADGMKVKSVSLENNLLKTNAPYQA
jgi:hypothetical protein